ncbi:MAG: diadenylate cyclase CdaA [Lachnospiraceae bacterium]|nr:diadenylate cyclase CdaA [Lachnospiraceae bacterium]
MSNIIELPTISFIEIIEILLLAFFIYQLINWCRNTRAWMLIKGIIVILLFYLIAFVLKMNVILWIFSKTINVGIILLLIVFQPELRRALEQLGQKKIVYSFNFFDDQRDRDDRFSEKTISHLVSASYDLAKEKTGALIVIERDVMLVEYERTGIILNSEISSQLLINIFEHNTPLHDGAVIIRGDKIVAATCYLPLSDNTGLSKDLGTRHRAGVGISEVSDSLTIIVSEETGMVSLASGGKITRDVDKETLRRSLEELQDKNIEPNPIAKNLKEIPKLKEIKKKKKKKG